MSDAQSKTTIALPSRRSGKSLAMALEVARSLASGTGVWMATPDGEIFRIVGMAKDATDDKQA